MSTGKVHSLKNRSLNTRYNPPNKTNNYCNRLMNARKQMIEEADRVLVNNSESVYTCCPVVTGSNPTR